MLGAVLLQNARLRKLKKFLRKYLGMSFGLPEAIHNSRSC